MVKTSPSSAGSACLSAKKKKKKKNKNVNNRSNIVTNSIKTLKTVHVIDFPGGLVVKNPPANAGNTGSISGLGRSHTPLSN